MVHDTRSHAEMARGRNVADFEAVLSSVTALRQARYSRKPARDALMDANPELLQAESDYVSARMLVESRMMGDESGRSRNAENQYQTELNRLNHNASQAQPYVSTADVIQEIRDLIGEMVRTGARMPQSSTPTRG